MKFAEKAQNPRARSCGVYIDQAVYASVLVPGMRTTGFCPFLGLQEKSLAPEGFVPGWVAEYRDAV